MSLIDDLIAGADPVAWSDADEGDLVASVLAHVIGGRYASTGEFILTLSIPAEIFAPHDLMKSIGTMTYWEARKA